MENDKTNLMLNKIKNRIISLSPTVKEGLEKECSKDDFFSEGEKPIGKGGFGEVWKVKHKLTERIYVIKVINKQNIIDQKMVEQINREVEIMYKLNHPHIIKLYNHFEDDENLYLILHYASKGQLYSVLKKKNKFDQRTSAQYMREIISAVNYLHSFKPPIIHRDIKPENILLDDNGRAKLADFGWSNYENTKRRTYCGTPEYLAPEIIKKEAHDNTVDIWDLGVLIFELLTGYPPFTGSNQNELFMNIKKHRIKWPIDFPPLAKNLISKILKQNPKERISLDSIVSHVWFEKNPPLKPVLQEESTDHKLFLESHLINAKPENIKTQINNIVEKENIAAQVIRKSSLETKNRTFDGNEKILQSPNNDNKQIMKELKEHVEKLQKESTEINFKLNNCESENKLLKTELVKLKDLYIKSHSDDEMQTLNDELEKYKIMNKDRLGLLAEIEEKNNETIELKNSMILLEKELESCKRSLSQIQTKYQEAITTVENCKQQINYMKYQIELLMKEKEDISLKYNMKLEILQSNLLEQTEKKSDLQFLEMIHESIREIEVCLKPKFDNYEKILKESNEGRENCEKKLMSIINEKNSALHDLISRIKITLQNDMTFVKSKFEKDHTHKSHERIEWLKKQISELMPYKLKSSMFENQISKLENDLRKKEEMINLHKTNVVVLVSLNGEKDQRISIQDKHIFSLEAKLKDIKDFLFRNHQDILEEFQKWYKL